MSSKVVFVLLTLVPFLIGALAAPDSTGELTREDLAILRKEHDQAKWIAKRVIPSSVKDELGASSCGYLKSKRFCHFRDIKSMCKLNCGCFDEISEVSCKMFKDDNKCGLKIIKESCRKTCSYCPWAAPPAKSCLEIKQKGHDHGNGLYWIDPNGGDHSDAFQVYCDMTSNGGGWTMCYTTNDKVRPTTETAYNPAHPYGKNDYRTNCNHIKFKEIMFVDEASKQTAYFSRDSKVQITPAGEYGDKSQAFGPFTAHGVAPTKYKYQLLMCDTSFFRGFFVSAIYPGKCYKKCTHWCGDTLSPYFRSAANHASYTGVAFNVNGHRPVKPAGRLISAGLR